MSKFNIAEARAEKGGDYVPFALEDYVENPVALARIKAKVTHEQLAQRIGVTQACISKIEHRDKVTPKLLAKVNAAFYGRNKSAITAGICPI